jgi:biopolymer transport protein ExbD
MSHIETGGSGRKVSLEVNLVPFIDLMSVLITFLLITAVWSQVSMIQIGSSIYGKKSDTTPTTTPPPDTDIVLKVEVRPTGYHVNIGKEQFTVALKNGDFDLEALLEHLSRAKSKYPNKLDGAIAMADELPYERLINVMDTMLKAGFPSISVLTGGPN